MASLSLRTHHARRLDGDDITIFGLIGACTGTDIEHGFRGFERIVYIFCDSPIRLAVSGVLLPMLVIIKAGSLISILVSTPFAKQHDVSTLLLYLMYNYKYNISLFRFYIFGI